MNENIRIDELVGFLSRTAPKRLGDLRRQFPKQAKLLAPGLLMGDGETEWKVYAEVARSFLEEAIPSAERAAKAAAKRLRRATKLELAAQSTSLIGAAVTTGLAIGSKDTERTTIAAGVTLIGNIIALWAKSSRSSLFGDKKTLVDHYQTLTTLIPEMQFAQTNLLATQKLSSSDRPALLTNLLPQLNRIGLELSEAQRGIGVIDE